MHPDLKIRIPRKYHPDLEPYWALVRKHGGSRKAMIGFITSIGGYSDRYDPYALEWDVSTWCADLDADTLWELLCSDKMDVGPGKDWHPSKVALAEKMFRKACKEHENRIWQWSVEEAWEGWSDSDMPYETWEGTRVEWKFELAGRGGKHLVMKSWECYSTKCSPEDLEESLNEQSDGLYCIPHADVRKLFIICVQNTVELTPEKVGAEVEYHAAWRLWVSFVEGALEEAIAAESEAEDEGDTRL